MDEAAVLARVDKVRAIADDDEAAHQLEDELYIDVLTAIAKGACADPAACARAALLVQEIQFSRWYA